MQESNEPQEGIFTVRPPAPDPRLFTLRPDLEANDAVRVNYLCDRLLADLGSVYRRAYANSSVGYPPELALMRRFIRDTQDLVQEAKPEAFFK